jgi:hypothetical protein
LERFAAAEGFALGRVYVEVETGKGSDAIDRRPQLAAALRPRVPLASFWLAPAQPDSTEKRRGGLAKPNAGHTLSAKDRPMAT